MEGDVFSKEGGVLECVAKRVFRNHNEFKRLVESGYIQPKKEEKKQKSLPTVKDLKMEPVITTEKVNKAQGTN
jgi:hypothetical protein